MRFDYHVTSANSVRIRVWMMGHFFFFWFDPNFINANFHTKATIRVLSEPNRIYSLNENIVDYKRSWAKQLLTMDGMRVPKLVQ
jgi:hypothetical protein